MNFIRTTIVVFLLPIIAMGAEQPNVLIIYADDIGNGDLSLFGQKDYTTPHIDQLAAKGMTFHNFYGCTVCAPARASLLTGRTNAHNPSPSKGGWECQHASGHLSLEEYKTKTEGFYQKMKSGYYLGQLALESGYQTAYFGKLGIGYTETADTIKLYGFDHHIGLYDSVICWGFYPAYYWNNGKQVNLPTNPRFTAPFPTCPLVGTDKQINTEDLWLKSLKDYLKAQKNTEKPFLAIYATQLPHGPASIAEKDLKFQDKTDWSKKEQVYASMVSKLDQSVGEITATLEQLDLTENTILIFMGDNGHEPATYIQESNRKEMKQAGWDGHERGENRFNGTLGQRGTKRFNHEGGLKVPFIIKWPEHIQHSSTSSRRTAVYDLMPTLAEVMGGTISHPIDGTSFLPTLTGKGTQHEPPYLHWVNTTGKSRDALIQGDWKLIMELDLDNSVPEEKHRIYLPALYNLKDDPNERNDLSQAHPEKVAELMQLIEQAQKPL